MDRRSFLKVLAAGVGAASIPVAHGFGDTAPQSLPALVDWFERSFDCTVGAEWAFAEERTSDFEDRVEDPAWWESFEKRDYSKLTPYHTYSVEAIVTGELDERQLYASVWSLFAGFIDQHPMVRGSKLYWRYPEKFKIRTVRRSGESPILFTYEQMQDGVIAPADVANLFEDEINGGWRETTEQFDVLVLRTRIAVPELQRIGLQPDESYIDGWVKTDLS